MTTSAAIDGARSPAEPMPAANLLWCVTCLAGLCLLYWLLGGNRFADYPVYLEVVDRVASQDWSWFRVEGLTLGVMRWLRLYTGSGPRALLVMAIITQAMTWIGLLIAAREPRIDRRNLLFAVALLAPLLALVTLRATPAYIVCAIAVARARLSDRPRLAMVLAAGCFSLLLHNSAVYVIAAGAVASLIPARTSRSALFAGGLMLVGGLFIVRSAINVASLISVAQNMPALSGTIFEDRIEYLNALTGSVGILHVLYFGFVSYLVYRGVIEEPPAPSDRLILVFYGAYCAMMIAPVVAVRSSHYFVLPVLLTLRRPLIDVGDGVITQLLHALACFALLVFSVVGVIP